MKTPPLPHAPLPDYYRDEADHARYVRRIFDETAVDYDRIERAMAFGSGGWYRRQALVRAGLASGDKVVDVGIGTGLLAREADWLPSWRELLRTLHRLEARGEVRGGRFISGLAGEQFALPEAIGVLRAVRRRALDGSLVAVSASDPLNLVGTLLPGNKVAAVSGNRVVYRDGVPVAARVAGVAQYWVEEDAALRERVVRDSYH